MASMRLELRDETGAKVADLDRDAAPLAAYSPYDGCVRPLHTLATDWCLSIYRS